MKATLGGYTPDQKWIITDERFPSEHFGVAELGGTSIRIERSLENRYPRLFKAYGSTRKPYSDFSEFIQYEEGELWKTLQHPSETALDEQGFRHRIFNNGTIQCFSDAVLSQLTSAELI